MKFVLAPDSFKGSLSSIEVSQAMKQAIRAVLPDTEIRAIPMADGGEGTIEALAASIPHEKISFPCTGPLGEESTGWYVKTEDRAIIEGAAIAGLPLVPKDKRNPDHTTSYGIGQAIRHALDEGLRDFIIAIGGSSTNDGGLGMLQALGIKALDGNRQAAGIFGKDLHNVEHMDFTTIDPRVSEATIQVACDVDNPLTGKSGASHVYGRQKGATTEQILAYDQALSCYGKLVEEAVGHPLMDQKGAGAAGGLGFAFLALGGILTSGAQLVGEAVQLEEAVRHADLVITGEGQSDDQTLYGKAPGYIAELCHRHKKPVILLSGSLDGDIEKLNDRFTACFSIVPGPRTLDDCLDHAEAYVKQATTQIVRLFNHK